jgi:flagellar motor switch protein FliN/FliY
MDILMDVQLELTVELGHASVPVREVLQLGPGAIVKLDKLAGEPVDVLVNGKLIARGEVVVVDETFGIRIAELVNRADSAAQAS